MAIHPTAIIDPEAELDGSVVVGPFCVIEGHVRVGAGTRIYQGVYLTGWTDIGENCELHPGVIVGHEPQDTHYGGERSYCRIGRGTVIREHATIHRGTIPESETVVGEECFLLGGCHVAHNCVVGDRVTLINNVMLAGHVEIGDDATLGGGAGVHQFVRVGELAMIAGNARVTKDVPPFALLDVDGRVAGLNRVGLRRAGFPTEEVREMRDAYRLLFPRDRSAQANHEEVTRRFSSPPVKRLMEFLGQDTPRGVAGRTRRGHEHRETRTVRE